MSIGHDRSSVEYPTDGARKDFIFPAIFFDSADLMVTVTNDVSGATATLAQGANYTVTEVAGSEGGTVTTTEVIPAGATLAISRQVEITQETVYPRGNGMVNYAFPAAAHERALDKLTMICQQLAGDVFNTLRIFSPGRVLRAISPVKDTVLGLDGEGRPKTLDAQALRNFLSLAMPVAADARPTAVFADAGSRMAVAAPGFIGQIGIQQDTGQIFIGTAVEVGAWAQYTRATRAFADDAARAAAPATPDFVSQLGVQTNTNVIYISTGTTPGAWTAIAPQTAVQDRSITLDRLEASARIFQAGAKGLFMQTGVDPNTVSFNVSDIILGNGAGGYAQFSTVAGTPPPTITIDIKKSGVNGLDAGLEAPAQWYHIWAISDGVNLGGIFSLSATAPTLPVGYTYNLYLGAVRNNATGDFVLFAQYGSKVAVYPQTALSNKIWDGSHDVNFAPLADFVPPTVVQVQGNVYSTVKGKDDGASVGDNMAISRGASAVVSFNGYAYAMYFDCKTYDGEHVGIDSIPSAHSLEVTGYSYNF